MELSGLYLHIPFCKSKCFYCDFFSVPDLDRKKNMVEALILELTAETAFLGSARPCLRTIYFGGGTPSLLEKDDFERIFAAIHASYDLNFCEEITIEANPDDLSRDYIQMLRDFPFNRISIGVQSFQENELKAINRRHTSAQAIEAIKTCKELGFDNISLDLMFGLPEQTLDSFRKSIDSALLLPVTHISSYALSWEEGSVLYKKKEAGLLLQTDDEILEAAYFELIERLSAKNFIQYELSNFSLSGFKSKHNSSYWSGRSYLGIGPAAHSFNAQVRRMNVSSLEKYMKGIKEGNPIREVEVLDQNTNYNDFIITRLRTMKGLDLSELELLFGIEKREYCLRNAKKSLGNGFLMMENNYLRLPKKAFFIADNIFSDLLWVES
jgi:oxygen-independent coproporphyrinogen III oxidase